jgi:hypothetical protein
MTRTPSGIKINKVRPPVYADGKSSLPGYINRVSLLSLLIILFKLDTSARSNSVNPKMYGTEVHPTFQSWRAIE